MSTVSPTMESKEAAFETAWPWVGIALLICVGVVLLIYLLHKWIQGPFYRKTNRIDGKVVIITGCNTGIGKETALELARRGGKIYMACRDAARCEAARLEIIESTKNQEVYNRTLDLGSLESVRQFAERFKAEESRLDLLINNAGIMATPHKLTVDGFEQQLGVNHLGHFLLTNLLLDRLKASAPSRIVVLSSEAYMTGNINKDDLNSEKSYSKIGAYSQSKLANVLFTRKLSAMLEGTGVTVNCCHPGVVRTELARDITGCVACMLNMSKVLMKTPQAGAQTSLRLALDPKLENSSGDYYKDSRASRTWAKGRDKAMADWLWQESEKLVGLQPTSDELQSVNSST